MDRWPQLDTKPDCIGTRVQIRGLRDNRVLTLGAHECRGSRSRDVIDGRTLDSEGWRRTRRTTEYIIIGDARWNKRRSWYFVQPESMAKLSVR